MADARTLNAGRDAAPAAAPDASPPARPPSVDRVLRAGAGVALLARFPRWAVVAAVREELAARRAGDIGRAELPSLGALEDRVADLVQPSLRPAINATGVVLHTNLGRAPLSARALARVAEVARGYCTLEYDTGARGRGRRDAHAAPALAALTGAEDALVVNNNAAGVLLTLAALAAGREVVVARGELVEIGGGFRVPDVMAASGARLVEVGTTNRTRLRDYLAATGPETAAWMRVHRSNFAMVGFTEDAPLAELARAARARGLPLLVDLGSGAFGPTGGPTPGGDDEPTVPRTCAAGADVCLFSGDKLLGGPQAGLIVGRRALLDRIRVHPLMRAVRPDKLTLAALEATLASHRDGTARAELPALAMLHAAPDTIAARALALARALADVAAEIAVHAEDAAVGGGALPLARLPSHAVHLRGGGVDADALAGRLARGRPVVICRVRARAVVLDMRTVADEEVPALAGAIRRALEARAGGARAG
ncbi:MAG TPA: L-seryl-tRNA(Sec) selenium transferase [Polyangia bacterium]